MAMTDRSVIESAFDILLEEIDHAIEGLNQDGAMAFGGGDYPCVEELGKKGQHMSALRERLTELRAEWRGLFASIAPRGGRRESLGQGHERLKLQQRRPVDGFRASPRGGEPQSKPQAAYRPTSPPMPKALGDVLAVCHEVLDNGKDLQDAYRMRTEERRLASTGTVANACLRAIGLNTAQFRYLLRSRPRLIQHLVDHYPAHEDVIREALGGREGRE